MFARSVLLIAVTALIAAPTAGADLLGPATGVTAARAGDKVDVTFTPLALYRAKLKTGTTVSASCYARPTGPEMGFAASDDDTEIGFGEGKVAAEGVAHVEIHDDSNEKQSGTLDYCELSRVRHVNGHDETTEIALAALTPTGAAYVDESERAVPLRHLLTKALAPTGYQPVAALGAGVVAMDGPDATPPAGQVGYWTDGTRASVATLSAAGRRLVIEDRGNLVVRTNVIDQMDPYGETDIYDGAGTTSLESKKDPEEDRGPSPYKSDQPLLAADGVRAALSGHRLTLRFTGKSAKTFRALGGRHVGVGCLRVAKPELIPASLFTPVTGGGSAIVRVPRHGGVLTAPLRPGVGEVCFVADDGQAIALVGAVPAGRAWVQDLFALTRLFNDDDLNFVAPGGTTYRPTAQVVAKHPGEWVAMSGPDGPLPVGKLGVWTDGGRQAAVAVRSASGRRFLIVDEGDGMARTNILSAISSVFLVASFTLDDGTTTGGGSSA